MTEMSICSFFLLLPDTEELSIQDATKKHMKTPKPSQTEAVSFYVYIANKSEVNISNINCSGLTYNSLYVLDFIPKP